MPYALFSKQDKLSYIADWVSEDGIREANYRQQSYLGSIIKSSGGGSGAQSSTRSGVGNSRRGGATNQTFGFMHCDEDKSFAVVESSSSASAAASGSGTRGGNMMGGGRSGSFASRWVSQPHSGSGMRGGDQNLRGGGGYRGDRRRRFGDTDNAGSGAGASPMGAQGGSNYSHGGHGGAAGPGGHGAHDRPYQSANYNARRQNTGASGVGRGGSAATRYSYGGHGGGGGGGGGFHHGGLRVLREPSIQIASDWNILREFDLSKLSKLAMLPGTTAPVPETIVSYGRLGTYNRAFDRVTIKTKLPLEKSSRSRKANVSTSADPVIRKYVASNLRCDFSSTLLAGSDSIGKETGPTPGRPIVYATDKILSQLMASTRSVFSWDIVVTRVGENIVYLDRRANTMDLVTVNENAPDAQAPPPVPLDVEIDGKDRKPSENLGLEATYINANYSQQVVDHKQVKAMPNPSPFFRGSKDDVPSSASVYRRWVFGGRQHNAIELVARTELDAVTKDGMMTIRALNHVPNAAGAGAAAASAAASAASSAASAATAAATAAALAAAAAAAHVASTLTAAAAQKAQVAGAKAASALAHAKQAQQTAAVAAAAANAASGQQQTHHGARGNQQSAPPGLDWLQKLDTQRAAVTAHEMRNNACKMARWTLEALLAGADWMHIGFVGRASARDVFNHVVMGTAMYRPNEIAMQTNLGMGNAWAILATFVEAALAQAPGTYVLVRDPNHAIVRLYEVGTSGASSAELQMWAL